jgi:hypothetical protein
MGVHIYTTRVVGVILDRCEPKLNSVGNCRISASSIFNLTGIHQVLLGRGMKYANGRIHRQTARQHFFIMIFVQR